MKLVVIEGPGKKDTIKKYLGSGYEVMATKGHIRDLPPNSFGVNLNRLFVLYTSHLIPLIYLNQILHHNPLNY